MNKSKFFASLHLFPSFKRIFLFLFKWKLSETSQDPNLFWDLLKNEISRRSFMKIFTRSHPSENNYDDLRRFLEEKIWSKTFSSKNLQTISSDILLEIFARSSIKIFLIFAWDLVFVLILKKICQTTENSQKIFCRSSIKIFQQSSYKSSKNLFEILWRYQKDFYRRSSEDLKKNF